MSDLNSEIDLLIDDKNPNSSPPSSSSSASAFENLNSWHNDYFQQNDFYSDLFSNQSIMPPSSSNNNNNNNTHEFTSNSLTFT